MKHSDISSDIFSGIYSNTPSVIVFCILFGILSDIYSGILFDVYSDILSRILCLSMWHLLLAVEVLPLPEVEEVECSCDRIRRPSPGRWEKNGKGKPWKHLKSHGCFHVFFMNVIHMGIRMSNMDLIQPSSTDTQINRFPHEKARTLIEQLVLLSAGRQAPAFQSVRILFGDCPTDQCDFRRNKSDLASSNPTC